MSATTATWSESSASVLHLTAGGVSLVIDASGQGLPAVVYWGRALEHGFDDALALMPAPRIDNLIDEPVRFSLLPEPHTGWFGAPGLRGARADRTGWSTRFTHRSILRGEEAVRVTAEDAVARLSLRLELAMTPSGVIRLDAEVRNDGIDDYRLAELAPGLALPPEATELHDLTGRWSMERIPQRHAFTVGRHGREVRRGRTGAESPLVLLAGEQGHGFASGQVWGVHLGWSGNSAYTAERTPEGHRRLAAAELLTDGEVVLPPGGTYASPPQYFSWGDGIDDLSARYHRHVRSRPSHVATPRPITLNVWEAVYFDQSLDKLVALADAAAGIGVERFVLDDGWFGGRRDSTRGLGDWFVSPDVWPDGLAPLVAHVRALGMQFGIWVEPEMINPDSDVSRRHPEWILRAREDLPPASRHQQALDLTDPDCFDYVLGCLTALVADNAVSYLKWDHNRDLIEAGDAFGRPAVHAQTLAAYRLMAELKAAFPGLEIESCSSGGARVDLGVLEHADRVWASDTIDPLERQRIQRWTSLLLPPELIGSHIGDERAHTTGRVHSLDFRAITTVFSHAGLELDLTRVGEADRGRLAEWIGILKELRPLIAEGTLVRREHSDGALWVTGSIAEDAVFSVVCMHRALEAPGGRVPLPGLDSSADYRVEVKGPRPEIRGDAPAWWQEGHEGVVASGEALGAIGLPFPQIQPEQAVLLTATRLPR
ncbi:MULTISPECIES: alpha-galactosidase [Bacteria]|uniref:alpha-galactosidase n=1 Tax=Bacteria TaxID=2 RepID=UPI003C79B397